MTNSEAISILSDYDINFERHTAEEIAEAHEMAIRVLEEERCELLILKASFSLRQAELKEWSERIKKEKEEGLIILPSYFEPILVPNDVEIRIEQEQKEEPQQKVGQWIEHKHGGIEHIECSECGIWFLKANLIRKSYCPNCGSCNGDMIKNIMRDIANNNGGAK